MARGNNQAQQAATSGLNLSNALSGGANSLYSSLEPMLMSESVNPQGFSPLDIGAMETAAVQSAGGAESGAMGRGALASARRRNAGSEQYSTEEAARTGGQQLSNATTGILGANANLKARQQQAGLGGLQGLYQSQLGNSIGALGIVPSAVNANTNAVNSSWDWASKLFDPILAAGGAMGAAKLGG